MAWKNISCLSESTREPELIERVLRGDGSAFRPLVETYERAVFALCRRLLGGRSTEAEDLTQETFLRAFRRLSELKDRRRFAPWLYQIARSLCRDWIRRARAERRALESRFDLERLEASGRADPVHVRTVLARLPDDERRALELKYFEGLSYRDTAERMGLSFPQVDHLIRNARQRLSRRLSAQRHQSERSL